MLNMPDQNFRIQVLQTKYRLLKSFLPPPPLHTLLENFIF